MKWVVVSFDEESKLYTVRNEHGRTCRANQDCVVYGVEGRKLKSVPRYTDDVLDAVKIFSMFADREVKTTEFGFKLLARSHNYSSADTDTMVQFVNDNPQIVNDLESFAKVFHEKILYDEDSCFCRARMLFCKILKSVTFDNLTTEKAHEFIHALIFFLNCDSYYYRYVDSDNDYDETIKAAKVFKQINGIAFHGIDDETIRTRKAIAFPFMAKYPNFAMQLVTKTYVDDLSAVFCSATARNTIQDYVTQCEAMETEPCFKGNILTLLASTKRLYDQKKDELKAKALHKMAKRFEWLGEFSCNGMGVVVFETPEDFATEGAVLHICVARYGYIDDMANQRTIICGVRKLDDIDTPFITCEVRLNRAGELVGVAQFYEAYNEHPKEPEVREFLQEFEEFIHNHK